MSEEIVDDKIHDIVELESQTNQTDEIEIRQIDNFTTFLYLSKMSLGTGILAYPLAISKAGVIPFVIIGIIVCVWIEIMLSRLIDVYNEKRKEIGPNDSPYPGLTNILYGKIGKLVFEVLFVASLVGVCAVYAVTGAELIAKFPWKEWGANSLSNIRIVILPFCLLTLPFMLLSDVQALKYTNFLALATLGISIILLLIYGFINQGYPINDINWYHITSEGFSSAVGTLSFTFPFAQIVLTCVNKMKQPSKFNKVSIISCVFLLTVYILFGSVAYTLFLNDGVKGNILGNMDNKSPFFYICSIAMSIICIFSIPNVAMSIFEIIDPPHKSNGGCFVLNIKVVFVRIVVLLLILLIGVVVPKFEVLVSFLGNFTVSSISFVLPGLMHYTVFKDKLGLYYKVTDMLSIILGSILVIFTTVYTIIDAVK